MKTRIKTAIAALAIAGAIGAAPNAASAASTPTNYRNAGDCTAYSQLTWTQAGGVIAVGQVPCNLRHSTTNVKVKIVKGGSLLTQTEYNYRNSLGTAGLRLTAPGGGWSVRPLGCDTYWAVTEASVSGVGTWMARSNAVTLCFS